jgi:hypothetical protein
MKKFSEASVIIGVFIIAVFFRFWFANRYPQPFIFDQTEYEMYAAKIYLHPVMLASHSYRSYIYPLFMALVYKITGFGQRYIIYDIQIAIDSIAAIIIYVITSRYLRLPHAALAAALSYALNPFSIGYVGVILSEIQTVYFVTATLLWLIIYLKNPTIFKGFLLGLHIGLAFATRNALLLWMVVPIGMIIIRRIHIRFPKSFIALVVGLFLTLIYPLYVNYRDFHEISITTVDNLYVLNFYIGTVLKNTTLWTNTIQTAYGEYYSEFHPERTSDYRKNIRKKYLNLAFSEIRRDPMGYLRYRLIAVWNAWQKDGFLVYIASSQFVKPYHKPFLVTINLLFLTLTFIGLFFGKVKRNENWQIIKFFIISSLIILTVSLALTTGENRYTIPFYAICTIPMVIGCLVITRFIRGICASLNIIKNS